MNKEHVESFLECAICRGVMQEPVMIKQVRLRRRGHLPPQLRHAPTTPSAQCLHRFCKNCLEHSLRTLKNECPLCRTRVPSRRSLERDTRFAKVRRQTRSMPAELPQHAIPSPPLRQLIELVYKDVGEYEAQQSSKLMAAAAASRANAAAILQAARTVRCVVRLALRLLYPALAASHPPWCRLDRGAMTKTVL